MPKNISEIAEEHHTSPGKAEELWNKAKASAEDEGRTGDWAYIMGTFMRMLSNNSKKSLQIQKTAALLVYAMKTYLEDEDPGSYV